MFFFNFKRVFFIIGMMGSTFFTTMVYRNGE